ncbi:MAG: phosphopentomutase [Elusimicrobia bacterium RIFOXYD2_FULL_34_15]|nr:MAG: phosphopentomutase [Elusimicrobia bacterium RIFOXYD2_FULL_34_15]
MRVFLIVLDSAGVGALPDAKKYNDEGSNTLSNIAKSVKNFNLPNLSKLGLYNLISIPNSNPKNNLIGSFGKMAEKSAGKDTTIGHWEIMGIITERPLPTYPNGFPKELIEKYENLIGTKILGNCTASGTEIIKKLGEEHCKTGYPIIYTSADSVFQIASHEDEKIFGLKRLYKVCEIARKMLVAPHNVGRVIARPFVGFPGNFKRTSNRKDYSLNPPEETLLDKLENSGIEVIGIGKIHDIFNGKGISKSIHTNNNKEGMEKILETITGKDSKKSQFIFINLVDFDMLWGHRRDTQSYYNGLKEFDNVLPEIYNKMACDDYLFITADHGCDPTYLKHTDHTREYVPVFIYCKKIKNNIDVGIRKTFADLGQTIADIFEIEKLNAGESFKNIIM